MAAGGQTILEQVSGNSAGVLRDIYFTPEELAEALGVTPRTIWRWQTMRTGPPRTKLGRKTLYRKTSVMEWLAAQESKSVRSQSARFCRRNKTAVR